MSASENLSMRDITYDEHVEMENQMFELRRQSGFASWAISVIVIVTLTIMIGGFLALVAISLR